MGWGCYKHEWDAGSDSWNEEMEKLCEERLTKDAEAGGQLTWGRQMEICPLCYRELEEKVAELEEKLEARDYEIKRLNKEA